ncbi:tannase/feruloyl esterase family alpha/beta hydrolase [Agrobacterium tumefaciens]|uniref:tannase/feruloyl esterase family alpha/beta hydrolase n=1 Tax=Agrobacterium tumefaciens TaxID=358 RepID=UPI001574BACE|nr:tannase/feruloyl esterase family alpha/beta hydrolase [Agrobacterium tumefaciens]WCK69069.1 tannase/feruloyl esterase family alpha/beta hydrolase [Agrobacterium tumefaciens]
MRIGLLLIAFAVLANVATVLPAHAAADENPLPLSCDRSIVANFKPNAETKVLIVKAYKKGDPFPEPPQESRFDPSAPPMMATADLCLVKLHVGPGNPGPADAPSTSAGIGIEVWLPAKDIWNGRVHAVGGSGWAGTEEADPTKISSYTISNDLSSAPFLAGKEGAVTASTDTGHTGGVMNGAFAMNPDGTINKPLWNDFASRAIHQQVVMAKALAEAYYGAAPKFTYWDGISTGGRQALKQAQRHPEDFDGILSVVPGINWSKFLIANVYPQIVIQRDPGGRHLTPDQLNLVSNVAIEACDLVDGKHLGFILDNAACRYDPTKDQTVLCTADGGSNHTAACLTRKQALAINKIWYGMTSDGSVPDPAVDNGISTLTDKRKWYGPPRGASLLALVGDAPFTIAVDMLALVLQDPTMATPSFQNAKANGADGWKSMSYEKLAQAFDAGIARQPQFGDINTDDPDLTGFKARGGKLIHVQAMNDEPVPYLGSVNYYEQVLATMGGLSGVNTFYRFYRIPGMAHGSRNGTANPDANPPVPKAHNAELYTVSTDWVEKGIQPGNTVLKSLSDKPSAKSLPMCAFPTKITHVGGSINEAGSYECL